MSSGFIHFLILLPDLNKNVNLMSLQGEKRREQSGPNEIVACTSCGDGSPCTHTAANNCATEVIKYFIISLGSTCLRTMEKYQRMESPTIGRKWGYATSLKFQMRPFYVFKINVELCEPSFKIHFYSLINEPPFSIMPLKSKLKTFPDGSNGLQPRRGNYSLFLFAMGTNAYVTISKRISFWYQWGKNIIETLRKRLSGDDFAKVFYQVV